MRIAGVIRVTSKLMCTLGICISLNEAFRGLPAQLKSYSHIVSAVLN